MMATGMLRSRSIGLLATLVAVVLPAILAGAATAAKLMRTYDLPKSLNYAEEIVAAPDGALWFTQDAVLGPRGQHVLGRITPAGAVSSVALPAGARAQSLAVGLDGGLWFADYGFSDAARLLRIGAGGDPSRDRPRGRRARNGPRRRGGWRDVVLDVHAHGPPCGRRLRHELPADG